MNYEGEVEYRDERKADVKRHFANVNKAKALLGYKPKTGLKQGLKKTVEWYKENQKP
jgi:nucleoside-diphosphate-sugar epimerase